LTKLPDDLSPTGWYNRFRIQAEWTQTIRQRLYQRTKVKAARRVLEVGCGPGVLTAELSHLARARIFGLDISQDFLKLAHSLDSKTQYIGGDGTGLPFRPQAFDLTFCHFLLLWVKNPLEVLLEMRRVTRKGCPLVAMAEPDYGGRIDYPEELGGLGRLEIEGLQREGANPFLGRKLASLFLQAGLSDVETGILGAEWHHPSTFDWMSEWQVMDPDLNGIISIKHLDKLKGIDKGAWLSGERILFVPTFYAIGWVSNK